MLTREAIAERRLARMRSGQSVYEVVPLPSDPEMRVALVPLTEGEYDQALENALKIEVPDTVAGMTLRDRRYSQELILRAAREPDEPDMRIWETREQMLSKEQGGIDATDLDHLFDVFIEFSAETSPKLDNIPEEEFERLKKLLPRLDWNGLSGRSWYAAKRFLGALISDGLLTDSKLGLPSN